MMSTPPIGGRAFQPKRAECQVERSGRTSGGPTAASTQSGLSTPAPAVVAPAADRGLWAVLGTLAFTRRVSTMISSGLSTYRTHLSSTFSAVMSPVALRLTWKICCTCIVGAVSLTKSPVKVKCAIPPPVDRST
jgi:hypothetical protein